VDRNGKVYGINHGKRLYVREGVSSSRPSGTTWRYIPSRSLMHISAGYSKTVALDTSGAIYDYGGKVIKSNRYVPKVLQNLA
jgi:alpha-tubulin suppressor-like RCC1 family protein